MNDIYTAFTTPMQKMTVTDVIIVIGVVLFASFIISEVITYLRNEDEE